MLKLLTTGEVEHLRTAVAVSKGYEGMIDRSRRFAGVNKGTK